MGDILVNKPAAAQRQLDAAIRMLFGQEDVLAIHTVAAAAHRLLSDLSGHRGIGVAVEVYESAFRTVCRDLLGKDPESEMIHREFPGFIKRFQRMRNRPTNFLKHADQDSDDLLTADNLSTDDMIVEACVLYASLGLSWTSEMEAFARWHLAVYPHEPGDAITTAAGTIDSLSREHQLEFGEFLITVIRERTASGQQAAEAQPSADREASIAEALEQIRTGQTVPAAEVQAWIESWDTSTELPSPTSRR